MNATARHTYPNAAVARAANRAGRRMRGTPARRIRRQSAMAWFDA
jgi:hypothetical protein